MSRNKPASGSLKQRAALNARHEAGHEGDCLGHSVPHTKHLRTDPAPYSLPLLGLIGLPAEEEAGAPPEQLEGAVCEGSGGLGDAVQRRAFEW